MALAVACSSTAPSFQDAGVDAVPMIDAPDGGDASASDAAGGDVVVHVRRVQFDGMPDTSAVVYHASATGALLSMETTGADGSVSLTVTAGDSVTVGQGGSLSTLTTVAGVQPGDELWFGPSAFVPVGQMTVTVPEHPEGGLYEIRGPCIAPVASSSTQILVRWHDGCPATRTVVAVALGAGVDGDDASFTAPLTVSHGGAVTLPGTWAEPVDVSVTMQGVTPGASLSISGALMSGEYATPHDGFERDTASQVISWQRPQSLNDGTYLYVQIAGTGDFRSLKLLAPGTSTMDLTPRVPIVTSVVESPDIAWTVSAASPIDAFLLYTDLRDGEQQVIGRWNFFLPPDARALVRPQIPGAPDTAFFGLEVVDVAGAGYDELRPLAATSDVIARIRVPAGYDVQTWKTRRND